MVEIIGTNLQEDNTSKEITIESIIAGISSTKDVPKKVEASRLSVRYLLAKGRPSDSLLLLRQIDAKNLPFNQGEREKMLNGILRTANGLLNEDPIEAWNTIWDITYYKRRGSTDFTQQEYERLNTQEFKNQQAATLAQYIKCYLNTDIEIKERERFARKDLGERMNDTTSSLYDLDFDKVFDSFDEATTEKLLAVASHHPLSVLRSKLQGFQETRVVRKAAGHGEKTAEEAGEVGEILSFKDERIRLKYGEYYMDIIKQTNGLWGIYYFTEPLSYNVNLKSADSDLATAIKDFKGINPDDTAEKIYQSLGKAFFDNLQSEKPIFSDLPRQLSSDIDVGLSYAHILVKKDGRIVNTDSDKTISLDDIAPWTLSAINRAVGRKLLEAWIKSSPAPTAATVSVPKPEVQGKEELVIEEIDRGGEKEAVVNPTVNTADQATARTEHIENLPRAEAAASVTANQSAPGEMLKSQAVPVKEPKAKVEVILILGRDSWSERSVKLKIGGKEPGIIWNQRKDHEEPRKGEFSLTELRKEKGKLMLPNGTRLRISKYISESGVGVAIMITGGRNTAVDIRDLIYFKDHNLYIDLQTNDSESWGSKEQFYKEFGVYEETRKCIVTHSTGFIQDKEKTIHGLSVKDAISLLKESLERK